MAQLVRNRRKCQHGNHVCECNVVITDAAKRISDAIRLAQTFHTVEECWHSFMKFKLEDGSTDHTLYPSKPDAAKTCSDENQWVFISLRGAAGGMSPRDAALYLDFYRLAYEDGMRMNDAQAPNLIMPLARRSKFG